MPPAVPKWQWAGPGPGRVDNLSADDVDFLLGRTGCKPGAPEAPVAAAHSAKEAARPKQAWGRHSHEEEVPPSGDYPTPGAAHLSDADPNADSVNGRASGDGGQNDQRAEVEALFEFLDKNLLDLKQAFLAIDGNRSGAITWVELERELFNLGYNGDSLVLLRLLGRDGASAAPVKWSELVELRRRRRVREAPAETAAAAAAIDGLLERSGGHPQNRPLRLVLADVMACRLRLAQAPATGALVPAGARQGARPFGRALAQAWMSSPQVGELKAALTPQGRQLELPFMTTIQMAAIRGLLMHLEWAVRNDIRVTAVELLESHKLVAPSQMPNRQGSDDRHGLFPPGGFTDPPPEEHWKLPGDAPASKGGSFDPAERVLMLREKLETVHGSLAEAFRTMDIDGRRAISFEYFHAHLVRLRLCRVDAEGSLRALELFKLLDRDEDDLISPSDCISSVEAAERSRAVAPARLEAQQWAEEQGILDPRFMRDITATGDLMLRLAMFRRWLATTHGSFAKGLHAMDPDENGWVEREEFVNTLIEEGYCMYTAEAFELFDALDIMRNAKLPIDRLVMMERSGAIGALRPPAPTAPGSPSPIPHVGPGGLFSDYGALDGPASPHAQSSRMQHLKLSPKRSGVGSPGPEVHDRLFKEKLGHRRSQRVHPEVQQRATQPKKATPAELRAKSDASQQKARARAAAVVKFTFAADEDANAKFQVRTFERSKTTSLDPRERRRNRPHAASGGGGGGAATPPESGTPPRGTTPPRTAKGDAGGPGASTPNAGVGQVNANFRTFEQGTAAAALDPRARRRQRAATAGAGGGDATPPRSATPPPSRHAGSDGGGGGG